MRYNTHLSTAFSVGLPLMLTTDSVGLVPAIGLAVGAVFPDIDESRSYIGRRLPIISHLIKFLFGHRGIFHSMPFLLLVLFAFYSFVYSFGWSDEWIHWFGLGYFMHIIMDSFSVSGVPLFKPFYDESIKLGLGKIYYRTGSLFEKSVFFITAGFVFILILQFNLIELFTEDIARWLSLIWQNVKDWRLFFW